jgi:hypothetical protein
MFLIFAITESSLAQTYQIPFGSQGNAIELEVVNTGQQTGNDLNIVATKVPNWIQLHQKQITLNNLAPEHSETVVFTFDATDNAPVGKTVVLGFQVMQNGNVIGTREFSLKSEAPSTFELFNNYPNPFNPATTISYQLPEAMEVNIQIFNILGQLVGSFVNNIQDPGKHKLRWDASGQSSGVYLYRISGTTQSGKKYFKEQKMLLVK